jgi:F-type H+-transporting ATPase subunit b
MDLILKQLGELLLTAVPTAILFIILLGAYRVLVHDPLAKILAQRHEKTAGAVAKAQADIAAAEKKTAEYEQRLREARLAVLKAQEQRRQKVLDARGFALEEARKQAQAKVATARKSIEAEAAAAKVGLQQQSESLAADVIRMVLKGAGSQPRPAGAQQ